MDWRFQGTETRTSKTLGPRECFHHPHCHCEHDHLSPLALSALHHHHCHLHHYQLRHHNCHYDLKYHDFHHHRLFQGLLLPPHTVPPSCHHLLCQNQHHPHTSTTVIATSADCDHKHCILTISSTISAPGHIGLEATKAQHKVLSPRSLLGYF